MLKGKKSAVMSKGIIGAVAVIIASAAFMYGYKDVASADIKTLVATGTAVITGMGLMYKRFSQTIRGLDLQSIALTGVTALAGVYVAVTGDNEGASMFSTQMNGFIISAGALLSAFGIEVATKKVGNG